MRRVLIGDPQKERGAKSRGKEEQPKVVIEKTREGVEIGQEGSWSSGSKKGRQNKSGVLGQIFRRVLVRGGGGVGGVFFFFFLFLLGFVGLGWFGGGGGWG